MSWLRFVNDRPSESGKTRLWDVVGVGQGVPLGHIQWFGRWRKYVFEPKYGTVFDEDCLRDIAAFCESRTKDHRRKSSETLTALRERQ